MLNDTDFLEQIKKQLKTKSSDQINLDDVKYTLANSNFDKDTLLVKISLHRAYFYDRYVIKPEPEDPNKK